MSADATSAPLTVYVAYHDSRPHPGPGDAPYLAVCNVRPDGSRPEGFPAYDDDGGFPDRNAAYCELSVLRRLETRATSPLVGLFHYRRLLLPAVGQQPRALRGEMPGAYHLTAWDWSRAEEAGAGQRELVAALAERDWCTAPPYDVRRAGFRSLREQFVANHGGALLLAADEAVRSLHPRLPRLLEHMESARTVPLWNVFLGRADVLRDYAAFLWPVLEACALQLPAVGARGYQGRWAGFVAERLHGYWLQHVGVPAGVRTGSLPVVQLGAADLPPWRRRTASRLPAAVLLGAHEVRRARRPLVP